MAKKSITRYRCSECGYMSLTEVGKCPDCGSWGTISEYAPLVRGEKGGIEVSALAAEPISSISAMPEERISSGIEEFDRVLGGGLIRGGVILLAGEPGIGKSTLLLQACAGIARSGRRVLYISGEESAGQLALRSRRIGISEKNIDLLCERDLPLMLKTAEGYDFAVVDSVQSFRLDDEGGWAGSPSQVRGVASVASETAKALSIPLVLIGHITKQGQIAGPKILEHMVDVVLLFSGERASSHRLLRAEKNRFGGTDEVGIFEMLEKGLTPVTDPSSLYWNAPDCLGRASAVSGVAAGVSLEGSRPLISEIQALSCVTPFQYPKRTARGIEINRLQLLLAVLERRCGIFSRNCDVYVNVAGGLTLQDTAADLSVCVALASALKDSPAPGDMCFIGEIGLAGEIRPVSRSYLRIKEARRMGFRSAVVSARDQAAKSAELDDFKIMGAGSISAMLERFMP